MAIPSLGSLTRTGVTLRIVLAFLIAIGPIVPAADAAVAPAKGSDGPQIFQKHDSSEIGNYDIRDDQSKNARGAIERYRGRVSKQRKEKIESRLRGIENARQRLEREIPGVRIAMSEHTGAPEVVTVGRGRQMLTGRSGQPAENVARGFLVRNADLYGLEVAEVARLRTMAHYHNPAGNLRWVEVKQEIGGLPVFRGELRLALTADDRIVATTGNLVPAADDYQSSNMKAPAVAAIDAVVTAAAGIGVTIPGDSLTLKEQSPDGTSFVYDRGPFTDDVRVQLEYFPLEAGVLTLAWSTILWQEDAAYYVYVSAEGGELLWRKNIVSHQTQPATYAVYEADSPAPLSPTTATPGSGIQGAAIPRTTFSLISELAPLDPWMPDGTSITTGNNVDAGLDLTSPNGIDAGTRATGTAFRVFDYVYNPGPGLPPPGEAPTLADYRFGEVSHMFFWTNRYHDILYALGFTEAARNFQQNNYGRGGAGNDRVLAEGQDYSGTDNANFATPPDGSSGRMQMYIFTGPTPRRTSALDQDVLLHELTHGTSNRLHANASGLTATMSRGMGEGWSDFYARAIVSGPDEDPNGIYSAGAYSTLQIIPGFTDNYYYGIRRFPYAVISNLGPNGKPYNPLTFADIDPTQINLTDGAYPRGPIGSSTAFQFHNIGEVWANALNEVRARFITRLGWATGNQLAMQLVTDGMKLDPVNPTLLQGRNSILTANAAYGTSANEVDIWRGFAVRGMGYSASAVSSASSSVVEAFDVPNATIGDATIVSDSCDSGGVADPGETVVISVPISNPYLLTPLENVIVTIGTTVLSIGSIDAGETTVQQATVQIPSDLACGGYYGVPVTVESSLGTVSSSVELQVGLPTGTVNVGSFSSGSLATPIVDNGTVEIPITVGATGAVGDVSVAVRLNHTFDGDLELSLVAPDGTTVALANNRGGSGDNFGSGALDCSGTPTVFTDAATTAISGGTAPFAGAFRPDQPLSGMRGHQMNGTWKLRVADTASLDVGTIGCVTLSFTEQLYFCCGVAGFPLIEAVPPATLVSECSGSANGAPDPGEVVTMSFPLRNDGSGLTTNLVATLRNGGGITSLSGPQSYGVLSPVGAPVARPFEFAVDSSVACGGSVVATFDLSDAGTDLGPVSFTIRIGATASATYAFANAAPVAIPASGTGASTGAPANPYPSTISVSGVSGTVVNTKLTLNGLSHTFPGDVDVLLVGPGGERFVPLSDMGGGTDAVNITLTLADDASSAIGTTLVSGTFRPANSGATDAFPAPAPAGPHASPAPGGSATFASVFGGSNPNGTWSLYVVDDAGADAGSIANGWELTFETADPVCATVNAPQITGASVDKPSLWPVNHKMQDVVVTYTTADDCASCSLSVSSNEPVDGTGDGNTSPDWEVVDSTHVRLRAERAATGSGRIYTITITCVNGTGTAVQTVPVHVAHDIRAPQAGAAFRIGTSVGFSGSFWDVAGRTHTAAWKFDNLSAAGTLVEPSGSKAGSVSGSYLFRDPGVYRVSMNITDNLGKTAVVTNAGDAEALVIIYDPNGGYVIGGGWFQSAAGMLRTDPAASGHFTFGYNSKYQSNSKSPKGEAQMGFSAGNLQFDASTLDSLVINGALAQVRGFGRLNGDGPYEFLLSMIDGDAAGGGGTDLVRVKIWHKITGQVVYDTQPGASEAAPPTTAVGAGSRVVIQK